MSDHPIIVSQSPRIIGTAADHGGFELKQQLVILLREAGHHVVDFGDHSLQPKDDYPDFVIPLARAVAAGKMNRGIAVCGSGVGACLAANKVAGVRACLISDTFSARQGVEDDDLNLICLGGQVVGTAEAWELVRTFLAANFSGETRHRRRLAKVTELETANDRRTESPAETGSGRRVGLHPIAGQERTEYLHPGESSPSNPMSNHSVIAVYSAHTSADAAVKELQKSGFDMKKLSIVGRDYQTAEQVVGYYNTGDRIKVWGKTGAFWGAMWGLLFGSAFFLVPGIGPILVAGPFISSIVGALEGAVLMGGLSAIGAGLASIGVPKDSIVRYETELKTGKFVLIVHGTPEDATRAKEILGHGKPDSLDHHQ